MAVDFRWQTKKIKRLKEAIMDCIEQFKIGDKERLNLLFTSCCRSGKTRMFSKALRLAQKEAENIVVIAVTIKSMPQQLYNNVKNVYKECGATDMNPMLKGDIGIDGILHSGDFLVLGWPQFNRNNNKLMQFDERWNNLETICKRTRDSGCIIILLIDEAHLSAQTDIARNIIENVIKPHIVLEVTATVTKDMQNKFYWDRIEIPYAMVADSGLVKIGLIVNYGRDEKFERDLVSDSDESVIAEGFKCIQMLKEEYKNNDIDCDPLLVIICKNGDEDALKRVEAFSIALAGISRVAIYTDGRKETLDGRKITMKDLNEDKNIKIVIAKQALATAWDCPRAEGMALLRSLVPDSAFLVQLLSRLLSSYEARTYNNKILDHAYVFSDIVGLKKIIEDSPLLKGWSIEDSIDSANVRVRSEFKDIQWDLHNFYILRDEKRNRIGGFFPFFLNAAEKYDLKNKIEINCNEVKQIVEGEYTIPSEGILGLSRKAIVENDGGKKERKIIDNPVDIDILFNDWVKKQVQQWAPKSALKQIRKTLYRYGSQALDISMDSNDIQSIVIDEKNKYHFGEVIKIAIDGYGDNVRRDNDQIVDESGKFAREITTVNGKREVRELTRLMSLFNPLLVRNFKKATSLTNKYYKYYYEKCEKINNSLESLFIEEFLEKYFFILAWIKQPDSKSRSFLNILYKYEGVLYTFLPDFIVMLKNGDILIIDTKSGQYKDEPYKACALQQYFVEENIRRKENGLKGKVMGGIADFEKKTQKWKIYNEGNIEKYQHDNKTNDLSNFKDLTDFINRERCYSF